MVLPQYRPTIACEIDFLALEASRIVSVSRRCDQARMLQNQTA
jgi:hypothetical protein